MNIVGGEAEVHNFENDFKKTLPQRHEGTKFHKVFSKK